MAEAQEQEPLASEIEAEGEITLPEEEAPEGEQDELTIELEGEEAEDEPDLVKHLRTVARDAQREAAELRRANTPKIEVGPEPDLWDTCEGDPDRYKAELLEWTERKRQAELQEAEAAKRAEVSNQQNQRRFTEYRAAAAKLPMKEGEFEAAENAVVSVLPQTEERPFQAILLHYTKEPAKLVVALAKYPVKLEALAAETDPIRVALAFNDMERNLKVTTRKKPPEAEAPTILRGSAPIASVGADKVAEKLLAEASKTGNMDPYRAHMKAQRKAA